MKRAAWTSCSSASLISIFLFVNFFCLIEPSFVSGVPQSNEGLCSLIVRPMGYPCTEYIVQTEDGYLLTLQRISNGRSALRGYNGPPVFLQHGLFQGGDTWFLNSVDESLGFILADHGFDVWVGNVRGTRWSSKHITLSEHERAFWDWSWQDLAQYDLAAMLSYVQTETNSKVLYIGHSQGTIMALAAFTMPDMVKMVEASALLCPISYLDHISSNFVLRAVSMHLDQMLLSLGIHQLNFRSKIGVEIMDSLCDGHVDCGNLLGAITGDNCCFNASRVEYYLEYEPHSSSTKNLHHLFQMIRKGTFAKYDFGWWENLKHYHSLHPPAFNLGDIPESLPLWIGYGGNDALADLTDLKRTIKELKSKPEQLYIESYGHIDFVFSVKAKDDVYADLIRFLRSRGRSTSY
ncbi:triacylglycerol lipase 1 isoform X1 [Dendrobium catenatum]|uniref:Lipase n=1 Tax=Dendrobium catenatum TaxID=906689 RepID=A0A2I0VVA0_9ASPA|nr:triacylglycerol lipase 1 isoform X1 [Dendrobium catenatum]PKU67331.1 Triacylglycerol lipase 1 [Dendrobium catenatum]